MAVQYVNVQRQMVVYTQLTTTNTTFLQMHYYLKDKGFRNNAFMLHLIDPDLAAVDPFDPQLTLPIKAKVCREASTNYWYFLRECVRIPDSGGTVGGGMKYQLHRGNLALNFCLVRNINTMLEMPRQTGKTVSALCYYLFLFNFGTTNSEFLFMNKKMDDSKLNLSRFRDLRSALPSYLRMDRVYDNTGKEIKTPNTVETLQHPVNRNKIVTVPSARNKVAAANLVRGRTVPLIWMDEYGFMPFNSIIYTNMVPAFSRASRNARNNGAPYGMLVTTTPGFLTTDEGREAYEMRNSATAFSESWYDFTDQQLIETLNCNTQSSFVYIRFTYQQLGYSEQWFKEQCRDLRNKWDDIRREILLEWSEASENCPFRKEDLEVIKVLTRSPIKKWPMLNGRYEFNIYDGSCDIVHYPPIIGVDVSGGYNRDSSAITVIDSKSTKVIADFNCNYISTTDLARVIYELVTKWMPNAVVIVERNGGYGSSVLSNLVTSSIKRNLYYEVKDAVIEETYNGAKMVKKKQRKKVYGGTSTESTREILIEILRNRVENHKDKFISPRIYDEMQHMEVKKSGRVEHSINTHDDQVFSYLWALYVWYEGKDLMENWGIRKDTLKTDSDLDEAVLTIEDRYKPILEEVMSEMNEEVEAQMKALQTPVGSKSFVQWLEEQNAENQKAIVDLCSTPMGREAYNRTYNTADGAIIGGGDTGMVTLPPEIFGEEEQTPVQRRFEYTNYR